MGPELRALVTEPVGQGDLAGATHGAGGENPVCGDKLSFALRVAAGRIEDLAFRATACPACIAVASCAVESLRGGPFPLRAPIEPLRLLVAQRGGLSGFEGHALALVEDVLVRAIDAL